ncbi:MAG: type II CAAX endopeptidase family protein [Planctomycetota bacterium]
MSDTNPFETFPRSGEFRPSEVWPDDDGFNDGGSVPVAKSPDQVRWWTPLAIAGVSLASFILFSGVMSLIALAVVHGEFNLALLRDPASFAAVSESRIGLFLIVVLPQMALVAPCILAAFLSPEPTRERLGLVSGHWPVWTWFAAAAATPFVGMVSGLVVSLFLDQSETLEQMSGIFRNHGQNGFLIPLALMIGATPAICEELLFRGYVQTRLVKCFGPLLGILVASLLFAAFHIDPVHVVAVLPLGLFLGWVSWQSGSLFPAMLGHFVNNVISVVAVVLAPEGEPDMLALPAVAFSLTILFGGVAGLASVSVASLLYGRPQSEGAGVATSGG